MLLATAVSATMLTAGTASAQADTTGATRAVSAKAATVIKCKLNISDPHNSHHQPKNINVISPVSCDHGVVTITLVVRLYRNGKRVKSKTFTKHNTKFLKGNASVGCKKGTYYGVADVRITAPPGYTPRVGTANRVSKKRKITCK